MIQPQEHVARAFSTLTRGLQPFVERELEGAYGGGWDAIALESLSSYKGRGLPKEAALSWDAHALLTVLWDQWNAVFRRRLGPSERSLVGELRQFRNRWAHQDSFDHDDAYRVLDSVERLLKAVSSAEAGAVARGKADLLRARFSGESKEALRKIDWTKNRILEIPVFLICGVALGLQIIQSFGGRAAPVALLVGAAFSYLLFKRLAPEKRGLHECTRCKRVIYTTLCPYCETDGPGGGHEGSEHSQETGNHHDLLDEPSVSGSR